MFSFKRLFRRKAAGVPKKSSYPTVLSDFYSISTRYRLLCKFKRMISRIENACDRVAAFFTNKVPPPSLEGFVIDAEAFHAELERSMLRIPFYRLRAAFLASAAQASSATTVESKTKAVAPMAPQIERDLPYKAINMDIGRLFLERLFVDIPYQSGLVFDDLHLEILFPEQEDPLECSSLLEQSQREYSFSSESILSSLMETPRINYFQRANFGMSNSAATLASFSRCASHESLSAPS